MIGLAPTTADVLRVARRLIERDGWWDGHGPRGSDYFGPPWCAGHAILEAAKILVADGPLDLYWRLHDYASDTLLDTVADQADPDWSISAWNDDPARHVHDVLAAFRRAEEAARTQMPLGVAP